MIGNILIVQPNAGLLTTLDILLKKHFSKVLSVPGLDEMTIAFEQEEIDMNIMKIIGVAIIIAGIGWFIITGMETGLLKIYQLIIGVIIISLGVSFLKIK